MWKKMRVGEIGAGFKEDGKKIENTAERKMNETF